MAVLSEGDVDAQQTEEETQASGRVAYMPRIEVQVSWYAVQTKVIWRGRDEPDLWALKMNVLDDAANEAKLDNPEAAEKETRQKENGGCRWCHGIGHDDRQFKQ